MIRIPLRRAIMAGVLAIVAVAPMIAPMPAYAQFGGIVYDPTNYAQNVLTAARSLQQINNQIQQIEQQATSLVNQAKNLAGLPLSTLSTLQKQIDRTRQLLQQAQRIAYSVAEIDDAFTKRYNGATASTSTAQMVANAQESWKTSVAAFQDTLRVQATVVGNLDDTRSSVSSLVSASQSASGALQAAQAGNQLLALQSQQIADLTALLASQSRAQALEATRQTQIEADAKERFNRFFGRK
ncbi:P-type conjugative transfer protein TrbJ [Sphingobium yanoikuyae]|jgi:P-type conjugative transfer protein TrbJ|uniref:P-type conjugative transfer protein TrbJ n=1 Tax=Sphingobium yanoikuyae TaxID=13690 RepID=A0A430C8Q2_SPHYA|nr:P-type conjugative transfer protein TrbJ [Sphingobium yanoikuyae]RSU61396.1 P-type conjugative transfer protein TrbJ [Sphingobium yanoikuyae]